MPPHHPTHIKGQHYPRPKLTLAAYWLFARKVMLPVFLALLLADALLYAVMRFGFDSCYGAFCWLE